MTVSPPRLLLAGILAALGTTGARAQAAGARPIAVYVATSDAPDRFPLARDGRAASLVVSSADFAGVRRAAMSLRADIERVTNIAPAFSVDTLLSPGPVVLIGTLGRSPMIDALVRSGRLDVRSLAGRWETFVIQMVANALPNGRPALVIAGSDKRGAIFGIYDLSAQIGVSPWHWWADVPVRRQANLFVLPGRHTLGEPAVRYRGIFINDEAPAFSGWARAKFGGVNHLVYERVFELLLRLKGNYLWPAMWGNAFADDDSLSPRLADEYGVVMGTSHHEPMTRAQQEWRRYGQVPWDYERNDSTLRAFWRAGIERMGSRENLITIGMRGDGDEPMTQGTAIALLERIVADQRKTIAEVTGKPASSTPQLWALYKEVQEYYDQGMRVPDDVTLLFSDDNWGNIRRLPSRSDRGRAGGFGVYYHFDYVGGPRNYKWLNTNPLPRIWEQMNLAYRLGADRIWIVNVGDIKPMELPIQFFLELAWNPDAWPPERLPEYTDRWVAQQFPEVEASRHVEIAEVITRYLQLASRRKPELLDTATYSLSHYREAETVVADWLSLAERARKLSVALPRSHREAYYQLVLHPVIATANLHELYVTVARNRLYARQGRVATNELADSARRLFERDGEISRYFNDTLAGGKWAHMMDQTHIGYTYWQEPPRNLMPRVDVIQVPASAEMGVAWEGMPSPVGLAARSPVASGPRENVLPEMDVFQRQRRYIEVYNRGTMPFDFTIETGAPWLRASPTKGTVNRDVRVWLSVDWDRAPTGTHRTPVTVVGSDGRRVMIQAIINNPISPSREQVTGFVEGSGYVSIEAEHYARAVARGDAGWQRIPDFGRTLSGVTPWPVTATSQTPGSDGPRLEYRMHLFHAGDVSVRAYLSPTLDYTGRTGLRYAISFDDEPPQIVNIHADGSSSGRTDSNRAWEQSVAENIKVLVTRHRLASPGPHVLRFWMVDPGVVLQKLVVDLGGVLPSYLGPPESYRR